MLDKKIHKEKERYNKERIKMHEKRGVIALSLFILAMYLAVMMVLFLEPFSFLQIVGLISVAWFASMPVFFALKKPYPRILYPIRKRDLVLIRVLFPDSYKNPYVYDPQSHPLARAWRIFVALLIITTVIVAIVIL